MECKSILESLSIYDWVFWITTLILGAWKAIELSNRFAKWTSEKIIELVER